MVVFPNCKINIGLRVTGKRDDGFHDIETIFYPVTLTDALEIIEEPKATTNVMYTHSGLKLPGKENDNFCVQAYELLKKDFPKQLPHIKLHLHKNIPMGAGLGGGSSDASFVLKLLNEKFHLKIDPGELIKYALQLGSDCPFFIMNEPCYATGRGEILEEIAIDLSAYKILVVNPGIHINTGWAFSQLKIKKSETSLKDLINMPVEKWQEHIQNDFETVVFEAHPEIAEIRSDLLDIGAVYSSMSGSGSSVFGIFKKNAEPSILFPAHYFWKWV